MAHKTLISGTAYSVTGGRELIGGTGYGCKAGKTLIGGTAFTVPFSKGIPLSTITYDEQCKWDKYAAMLPYTPWQIVWSKYVLTFLCLFAGAAMILLASAMRAVYGEGLLYGEELLGNLALLLAVLLMLDVSLPLVYRFGSEKGRLVMILVMLACLAAGMGVSRLVGEVRLPALPALVGLALGVLILAAATGLSFWCSLCFYLRRRG